MKLPDCFYQKAFWIVIPILIASFTSGILAINNQIMSITDDVKDNSIKIAENNVPELKKTIEGIDLKVDSILINQARLEAKIEKIP